MRIFFLLVLISSLFIVSPCFSADYFVSPDGDNSDGSTWAKAWSSFNSISWGSLSSTDIIYIDGGNAGKTYAETLTIGASGATGAANHIFIKTGAAHPTLSSGHDGLVTITGVAGSYGINFNSNNYVTIDGNDGDTSSYTNANLKVYDTEHTGIYAPGCTEIKILYVFVDHCGDADGENGIRVTECDGGSEIGWCRVEYPYQDGVKIGKQYPTGYGLISIHDCLIQNVPDDILAGDGGVDIYRNILGPWCDDDYGNPGHMDGFQSYDGYLRIWDNVFRAGNQFSEATNAALYLTNAFDRNKGVFRCQER